MGCSVRRTAGGGILCRHVHSLFRPQCSSPHSGRSWRRSSNGRSAVEWESNGDLSLVVTTALNVGENYRTDSSGEFPMYVVAVSTSTSGLHLSGHVTQVRAGGGGNSGRMGRWEQHLSTRPPNILRSAVPPRREVSVGTSNVNSSRDVVTGRSEDGFPGGFPERLVTSQQQDDPDEVTSGASYRK